MVAEGIAVDATGAHAAAGALAADNQAIAAELSQMSHQRRAEEAAGAFLKYDHIAGLWLELFLDLKRCGINFNALAIGRIDRIRFGLFARLGGRVKHWN